MVLARTVAWLSIKMKNAKLSRQLVFQSPTTTASEVKIRTRYEQICLYFLLTIYMHASYCLKTDRLKNSFILIGHSSSM